MSQESKIPYENPELEKYSDYLQWREKIGGYLTATYIIACATLVVVAGFLLLGQ